MSTALCMSNGLIYSNIAGIHFCLYAMDCVTCHMMFFTIEWNYNILSCTLYAYYLMIVYADDNSQLTYATWNDAFM